MRKKKSSQFEIMELLVKGKLGNQEREDKTKKTSTDK